MNERDAERMEAETVSCVVLKGMILRTLETLAIDDPERTLHLSNAMLEAWGRGVRDGVSQAINALRDIHAELPQK